MALQIDQNNTLVQSGEKNNTFDKPEKVSDIFSKKFVH
jgi:hypothetical protein